MRVRDVVWDVAVGDEANVGRLVGDGSYLTMSFPADSSLPSSIWPVVSDYLWPGLLFLKLTKKYVC